MKNNNWIAYVGLLILGPSARAVDRPVDLSGTWVLDKTEQSFSPNVVGPEAGGGGYPGGGGGMGGGFPGAVSRGGYPGGWTGGRREGGTYPGGGGPAPNATIPVEAEDLTLAITQTPNELKLERKWHRDGKEQSALQAFALDRSENSNRDEMGRGELNTKARWHKGTLIVEGAQHLDTGNREIDMPVKQEFSLSKDGKSLIVKTTRQTPRGMMGTKQIFRKS